MKKSTTKRALLSSVLALVMCFGMLTGTTFAWFTDTVTSSSNIIAAGNLDVELYNEGKAITGDATKDPKFFNDVTLWEPGAMAWETFTVKNAGTLALKYTLEFKVDDSAADVSLAKALKIAVIDGVLTDTATRIDPTNAAYKWQSFETFVLTGELDLTSDAEKEDVRTFIVWWKPSDNDNDYNMNNDRKGDKASVEFNLVLKATQLASEEDAFGSDYDKDAWLSGMPVMSGADLQAAINNGETNITLMDDIELNESIVIPAAPTTYSLRNAPPAVEINLNGKTITIETAYSDNAPTASSAIVNNGNVVLTGKGTIKATNNYTVRNYGNMVIDGVTVENGIMNFADMTVESGNISNSRSGKHTIYSNSGSLTINGGSFYNGNPGNAAIFSYSGEVVINGGEFSIEDGTATLGWTSCLLDAQGGAKFTINGGVVNGEIRDYGKNTVVNGGTFTHNSVKNFVADGFKAVQNADGTYTVAMKEGTFEQLISGAQSGDTVVIPEGTYTFPASDLKEGVTLQCTPGTVFDGKTGLNINGATVVGATFTNDNDYLAHSTTINGTFKDCVFTDCDGLRSCYAGETVVFENCVFDTDFYGVHFDGGANDVVFKNCTFTGFNTFGSALTKLTLEDCTFKYNGKGGYNGINMWGDTDLINCTFVFDGSASYEWVDLCYDNKTVTFTNCVVTDGTTKKGIETVVGDYGDNNTIILDGAQLVISNDALNAAIEAKVSKILLANGDYSVRFTNNTSFNVDNMTIVGMGDNVNLSVSSSEAWYGRVQGDNVTFVNVNFTSSVGATGKATYNNCKISHLECASSGSAKTYVNDCEIGTFHTSADLNSGDAYVKNSTITKAEYSGNSTMNFEKCTIGELISWDMKTVLTGCTVEILVDDHITSSNTIVVNP